MKLDLPENYTHFLDNKQPAFLEKFPHGKIPALEAADGFKLFETSAIARYGESNILVMAEAIRDVWTRRHPESAKHLNAALG